MRPAQELNAEKQTIQSFLCKATPTISKAYDLAQKYVEMIHDRKPECLDEWLDEATNSAIDELRNFASRLKSDYEAVKAALSLPWSNGQTEGQVHRLKLIKRQMYGRAGFDLLRKRVLYIG